MTDKKYILVWSGYENKNLADTVKGIYWVLKNNLQPDKICLYKSDEELKKIEGAYMILGEK